MRHTSFLSVCLLLFLFAAPALADKRVALVIGNGAYVYAPKLPNPKNDAEDVSAALKRVGFDVISGLDLDKSGMDNAAIRFARAARDADVAVFYYSGHAMQFAGTNYLMPVDAKLADEADLRLMVRSDSIVADLQQAKNLRILVLDSCRDNPLADELKRSIGRTRAAGLSRGLAPIVTPEGMIVAYATQAGRTAEDGSGRNSPYTTAFLKYIEQTEEIGTIFRRISADVFETTKRTQLPELSLSFIGEFYLKDRPAAVAAIALPDPAVEAARARDAEAARTREAEAAKSREAEAARVREIAALQEKLQAMQEQLNRRDTVTAAPPIAAAPVPIAPAPPASVQTRPAVAAVPSPARPQQQAARDPYNLPPPPEPSTPTFDAPRQQAAVTPPVQPLPQVQAAAPVLPLRHIRDVQIHSGNDAPVGAFMPDNRTVLSMGRDETIRRWDAQTQQVLQTWSNGQKYATRLALSPDGTRLVVGTFGRAHVYSGFGGSSNAEPKQLWEDKDGSGCTGHVAAFSPNGRIVVGSHPVSALRLYDAETGKVIRSLRAQDAPKICGINTAVFTPDGRYLVTSTYRVFEVATGKLVRTLSGGVPPYVNDDNRLAMSPDGRRVVIARGVFLDVWDVDTGNKVWSVVNA